MNNTKIGFIGSGNMTSAIVGGMLNADFNAKNIYLSDANADVLQQKSMQFGVNAVNNQQLLQTCEVIILAVKPQIMDSVCLQIKDFVKNQIFISIAAGITTDKLQKLLNTQNIIRTMPNTPAMVGLGASGIYSLIGKIAIVDKIFNSFGICVWVDNESDIDSITALSGSGPAYFYLMFEAMIKTAIEMGLNPKSAKQLCLQTAIGTGIMAQNDEIKTLRENVTSKGGTTQKALECFADNQFEEIIKKAMLAAKNRADELSNEL